MSNKLEFLNGNFVLSADARKEIDAQLRRVGLSGEIDQHEFLAQTIIPPIKQIADYQEWTGMFFGTREIGPLEQVYIAVDNPSMVATYTSPNGEVFFTRPGRTVYVQPAFIMFDTGLEIGWDDMASSGWDILGAKVKEAGEELARKRDAQGLATLTTSVASVAGHATSVSGGAMTKAAVDAVFRAAATAGWSITQVAINSGTIMDMSNWVWSSSNHLWQEFDKTGELFNGMAVSNYGGATWRAFTSVSSTTIWMSASPAVLGAYRWRQGGIRHASDIDIRKRVDVHTWDEKIGHYIGNPYALWNITITA